VSVDFFSGRNSFFDPGEKRVGSVWEVEKTGQEEESSKKQEK